MSSYTRRRELYVSLKLIVCIALGIWLGALAVALTGLLIYKILPPQQSQALSEAATRLSTPPPQPAATDTTAMFEKYQQSLRESEARQAREQADAQRNRQFNRAKCEFWLQQDRTAPSDKSRTSIIEFCG